LSDSPLVSIVLVTYNQERFIGAALDSILSQDYPNFEIIVCDDASRDATPSILREYERKHPGKVILNVQPKNLGLTANTLSGIPFIRGKYVVWFAGDDLFLPGKLSRQVAALQANPKAIACYHDLELFDSDTGQTLYTYNDAQCGLKPVTGETMVDELLRRRCFVGGISVMVDWERTHNLHHRVEAERNSDWLYYIELAQRGEFVYIADPLARYRRHSGNVTSIADISDELRVYRIVETESPRYQKSVHLGRARLYASYVFRHALGGHIRKAIPPALALAGLVARRPNVVPYLFRGLYEMAVQRAHMLRRTGRIER
jgi:glycosyltransferase involved in cell wall biosynthesis